jgi:GNAT superfamily N-acetyltransferase
MQYQFMELLGRAAAVADAEAMYQLIAAAETGWHGRTEAVPDQVAADLSRPELDLARDTLLLHTPDGDLAGWAWLHLGKRAQIVVHPSYLGQGIGTRLLDWAEQRAREVGTDWFALAVDDADTAGTALLKSRGADVLATNWLLERPITAAAPGPLPAGLRVATYDAARAHDVHELIEDAFSGFQPRRKPFEEWALLTVERDTFRPDATTLAYAGDELVGVALALDLPGTGDGYIEQVAVRADQRNKGLARAMLDETSAAFQRIGRHSLMLWTHSGTGALAMYQRLGLRVRRSTRVYRLHL